MSTFPNAIIMLCLHLLNFQRNISFKNGKLLNKILKMKSTVRNSKEMPTFMAGCTINMLLKLVIKWNL